MPTVREFKIDDLLASLPEWRPISNALEGDLFLGAVGFEERSSTCFERWCAQPTEGVRRALLIIYPINKGQNEIQRERFRNAAERARVQVDDIPYERLTLYADILRRVRDDLNPRRIVIDISSMASFAFYPLMAALFEGALNSALSVCYTEAGDYFPSLEEWEGFKAKMKGMDLLERARLFDESHFHSKGVDTVYEAVNYPGANIDTLPTRLIIVPNFSFERVNRMVDFAATRYHVERINCEWIIGMSPDQAKNGWRYQAVWEMYATPSAVREASVINYKEMVLTLQEVWKQHYLTESLMIASVGSKAQHLGTVLFLAMHPEVGLVLAEPKEHNTARYSAKAGRQWSLDFGIIGSLVKKVQKWNRLEFEWDYH